MPILNQKTLQVGCNNYHTKWATTYDLGAWIAPQLANMLANTKNAGLCLTSHSMVK